MSEAMVSRQALVELMAVEIQRMHGSLATLQSWRDRLVYEAKAPETAPSAGRNGEFSDENAATVAAIIAGEPGNGVSSKEAKARRGKGKEGKADEPSGPKTADRPAKSGPKPGQNEDPRKIGGVRELPEPFTAVAVNVALGMSGTSGNSLLARWEKLGWVKRGPARGQWSRTATYGQKPQSVTDSSRALLETMKGRPVDDGQ